MKVGLIGFSQCGKSTLFESLTGVQPDPAAAIKGQIGISEVADDRLSFLSEIYKPKKHTPATVEFIDTPGLIVGESDSNAQRIATLRTADGLAIVINAFSTDEEPVTELKRFREELVFADILVLNSRMERILENKRKGRTSTEVREKEGSEYSILKSISDALEGGESIKKMEFTEDTEKSLRSFQLFALKEELVILNCAEDKIDEAIPQALLALNPNTIVLSASLEIELANLDEADRPVFMEELGVKEIVKDKLIRLAYDAVKLISFFTVGEDECKAWTISDNTPAVVAAGKIHSDIARGFIRAEVVKFDDLKKLGAMKEVKAKGLHRLEGKEYIVCDGDIINYRFNV